MASSGAIESLPQNCGGGSGYISQSSAMVEKEGSTKGNAKNPKETQSSAHSTANMAMDYVEISKPMHGNGSNVDTVRDFAAQNVEMNQGLHANKPTNKLEEIVVGLNLNDKLDGSVGETNGEGRK